MALLGFKIIRGIKFPKIEYLQKVLSYSNHKAKYEKPHFKAASTLTRNKLKVEQNANVTSIPIIPSEMKNTENIIKRKFAKSSTHSAITQPLKMPRLANPFPEPVKILRSDTVSDQEKARLMDEQIKMEARFYLQQQQEMQLSNNQCNQTQDNNYQTVQNSVFTAADYRSDHNNSLQNSKQPVFRKPKSYEELAKEANEIREAYEAKHARVVNEDHNQQHQHDDGAYVQAEQVKPFKKFALNIPKKASEICGIKKLDGNKGKDFKSTRSRRKSHARATKYFRHSCYPRCRNRQIREYSSCHIINPQMKSDVERCDMIIKALKRAYPEKYKNLEKPVFVPGSTEEKAYIDDILKLLAKHKIAELNAKKNKAPFPSYSEVKTFISEAKVLENSINNNSSKDISNIVFNSGSSSRHYSTDDQLSNRLIPTQTFKFPSNPSEFTSTIRYNSSKQDASYPGLSEIRVDIPSNIEKERKQQVLNRVDYKNYCTNTSDIEAKKKPPCKNPFKYPECDYAKTIKKKEEDEKKKHCPNNKKKCSPDNKIIDKLRNWFSTKSDPNNIKICRSPIDVDGRETYVIEVNDCVDLSENTQQEIREIVTNTPKITNNTKPNIIPKAKEVPFSKITYQPIEKKLSHLPEMADSVRVLTKNIPDFSGSTDDLFQDKQQDNTKVEEAKNSVVKFQYVNENTLEFSPKNIKLNEKVETVKPVTGTKIESNTERIRNILEKPNSTASKINLVKEQFLVKPDVFDNKNLSENSTKSEMYLNPLDKYHPLNNLHMKRNVRSSSLPQIALCSDKKDETCKKKGKKEECPRKKCRPLKKRKVPNCEDVKGNKPSPCFPIKSSKYSVNSVIPKVESVTEIKNTASMTNFNNLRPKIAILANQESSLNVNCANEPFKLKPQFWKK